MSTFYIASNYITYTGVAGGFGHLQMVYDTGTQLREIEVQAPTIITAGDWNYPSLPRVHNATTTPGFEVFGFYKRVEVDLRPEQTAQSVWNLLSQFHESMKIHGANIDYDIYQNSNSYVYTALKVIGVDLSGYISSLSTATYSTFPGQFKDVLQGADVDAIGTIANIAVSLAGTSGADYISTGNGNDTLSGGVGHDTIFSGNGGTVAQIP